ncbi:M20 family metallopeptidase [Ruminococcaceae bacterium OttesenSCG-928-D13]|nr:M20 family metallopeptidase [Ruminococcaceae bacterium OttesenSCG-928-D13]
MNPYLNAAQGMAADLAEFAAGLHRRPEPSFLEVETTRKIKAELEKLSLEPVDTGLETGAAALLRGAKPGGLVVLRADIDAIAVAEDETGPGASEAPGLMHACGHDVHTACLLGAARLLAAEKANLAGDVLFLFQPGEEVTRGATALLGAGLLEKLPKTPDALFGLHSAPALPAGTVGVNPAEMMAGKTNFTVTFTGVGGHGGQPHQGTDVLVAGAAFVAAVQTVVSRNTDPLQPLVCAVHTVHAGEQVFFPADTLQMTGSVRALDAGVQKLAEDRLVELAEATAKGYRCGCEMTLIPEVPPLVNDPALVPLGQKAAGMVARQVAALPPTLLSDDFSVLAAKMPGLYYWLGTAKDPATAAPLHHRDFSADPQAIPYGSALLAQSAVLVLAED